MGGSEGVKEVSFFHRVGGGFKAPVTLQFKWLGKWKRWSELDARTREDWQNTHGWRPQVVWLECLTQLRNKAAKQSRNRAREQHQLFSFFPPPSSFHVFMVFSSALPSIFRTPATELLLWKQHQLLGEMSPFNDPLIFRGAPQGTSNTCDSKWTLVSSSAPDFYKKTSLYSVTVTDTSAVTTPVYSVHTLTWGMRIIL